jgi:hypothetical protein
VSVKVSFLGKTRLKRRQVYPAFPTRTSPAGRETPSEERAAAEDRDGLEVAVAVVHTAMKTPIIIIEAILAMLIDVN